MTGQNSAPKRPKVEKEVRFAVVMYGGVSLAIYINGVAQELLKMVRATARKKNKNDGSFGAYIIKEPEGTEAIYRELGERLKARFVVDILSGTSAGGINAIYLAKALANNLSMTQLESLWIKQGDIKVLVNDKNSLESIDGLKLTRPLKSLLNSDRMYCKLLDALDNMDQGTGSTHANGSAFVDELDLYVTSTDLRGLSVPIMLADGETHENRYRTVFRFHHSTLGNQDEWLQDFKRENNPFLAFVARATSAFPYAFQPAKLHDAKNLLGLSPFWKDQNKDELAKGWNIFYKDYNSLPDSFDLRSFGDGGALDNKPFSYITETLLRRQSDIPVDRRLFYIEPAPERPKTNRPSTVREPDVIENVLAQAVNLPRYETIREDLLQIKARNELIERTNNILRQIGRTGQDISNIWQAGKSNDIDWNNKYLNQILGKYGAGYAAYHQLRVSDTLDNFAVAVARNIGMEEGGTPFSALRQIIEEWRRRKYSSHSKDKDQRSTENDLLYRMDLGWHIRRLHFVLRIIDDILLGLRAFRTEPENTTLSTEEQDQRKHSEELVRNSNENGEKWTIVDQKTENQYTRVLSKIKHDFNNAYVELKLRGRKLRRRNLALEQGSKNIPKNLRHYVRSMQPLLLSKDAVQQIIEDDTQLQSICDAIEEISLSLGSRTPSTGQSSMGYLHEMISRASERCKIALAISDPDERGKEFLQDFDVALRNVQACLRFYYQHFEYFDMLTFPITYATPIGESDMVDVYRISPEDATGLFVEDEKKHKLAGIKFWSFGGFLREEWRRNDILWGQLDAAERIIVTLLPDPKQHKELLVRVWLTILRDKKDTFGAGNLQKLDECWGSDWERFVHHQAYTTNQADDLNERLRNYFTNDYKLELESSRFNTIRLIVRLLLATGDLTMSLVNKYAIGLLQSLLKFAYVVDGILIAVSVLFGFIDGAILGFNRIVVGAAVISLLVTLILYLSIRNYKNDFNVSSDPDNMAPSSEPSVDSELIHAGS